MFRALLINLRRLPFMKSNSAAGLLTLLALLVGQSCLAHQKWLLPNVFVAVKGPLWISFDVTWSDQPFTAESGVGEQSIWVVDPEGKRTEPPRIFVGKTKSVAEVELTKSGTYRLEAIDPLTYWTRVEEDGQQKWLKKPKDEVTGAKITRSDLYWSKALAYVTLGEPTELPAPDNAEPLDIRPHTHPNRVTAGEPLKVQVFSYAKPVAAAKIKVFGPGSTGHEPTDVITSGETGTCQLKFDVAGRYLVSCELERKAADDPKADIHSFNVYLSLDVSPAPNE